tara:strand:- start:8429 stop:8878 length:450 start_codon:yes stop_codon:yes gene_type:complete
MPLLVHLRVLAVRRLRVTAVVTIGTVVCVAVGGGILSHAFRKTWTLGSILRSSVVTRGSRLIPDGRQLSVRSLTRHTDSLAHLSIDRSFTGSSTLMRALLHVGSVTIVIGFALGLLLLLLSFPLLANLLKFYGVVGLALYSGSDKNVPR